MDEKTPFSWGHPLSIDRHSFIQVRKEDQDGRPVTETVACSDSTEVNLQTEVLSDEAHHNLPGDFPLHKSRDSTPSQEQCVFPAVLSL